MSTPPDPAWQAVAAGPRLTVIDVPLPAGAVLVTVTGELDVCTTGTLAHRISEIRAAHPDRPLHLDLSGLLFCDVAGLRALCALGRADSGEQRRVRIVAAGRCLDLLLYLCRVPAVLEYAPPAE